MEAGADSHAAEDVVPDGEPEEAPPAEDVGGERQRDQQVEDGDADDVRPDEPALVVDELGARERVLAAVGSDCVAGDELVEAIARRVRDGPRRARLGFGFGGLEKGRLLLDRFYRPPSITSLNRSF
jgi:hypothetical protein